MKRFIITYLDIKGNIGVVVIKARTEIRASSKVLIQEEARYIRHILTIRELYNPREDIKTKWMFIPVEIPEEDLRKYEYWDKMEYNINFDIY